ncbi:multicopper oxidase family protein [Corynebacterium renale]|uniref:multicopper oxidase family protein n=1 Tax=Corynebacterium renale TaxID=1724 RepID=UPI000B203B8B
MYFKKGDRVQVNVHNGLDEMTTIHWHGMKIPAEHDGGPHQPIEPGEVWEPQWTIEQPAATLWYHPHPHERTALHAYRGLAGGIVIDDGTAEKAGLPRDYGVDDIPVIIMDQKFNEDGSLNEESDPDLGLKGDVPTVNGITNPYFNATTTACACASWTLPQCASSISPSTMAVSSRSLPPTLASYQHRSPWIT